MRGAAAGRPRRPAEPMGAAAPAATASSLRSPALSLALLCGRRALYCKPVLNAASCSAWAAAAIAGGVASPHASPTVLGGRGLGSVPRRRPFGRRSVLHRTVRHHCRFAPRRARTPPSLLGSDCWFTLAAGRGTPLLTPSPLPPSPPLPSRDLPASTPLAVQAMPASYSADPRGPCM